jgi:Holliday junction resolvasome RuvABC endonuclease subunit
MPFSRVLAFDLSLAHTGWCAQSAAGMGYGLCPNFRKKKEVGDEAYDLERLSHILKFVKPRVEPDTLVVIEDFSFASQGQALFQLGGLGYLIRYWLWQNKTPFVLVSPTALKKFVCGAGNAKKAEMVKEVFRRFEVDVRDDNVADAVGLCYLGLSLIHAYEPTTEKQREVTRDLQKKFALVLAQ